MTDGTLCDLINQPRITKVLYVCYAAGKNQAYSVKEPTATVENKINCIPLDESGDISKSLFTMELKAQYQKLSHESKSIHHFAIYKEDPKDETLPLEMVHGDKFSTEPTLAYVKEYLNDSKFPKLKFLKDSKYPKLTSIGTSVQEFLSGKNCLTGDNGWWKFEFCYGRYIRQFHVDENGENSITLGRFDERLHKKWLDENETKKLKPTSTHLSHHYQGGNFCEKTGEKRQTEVKLKCMEGSSSSPTDVSLYLMEPQMCQYVLDVESSLICDILQGADEYGLMSKEDGEIVREPEVLKRLMRLFGC